MRILFVTTAPPWPPRRGYQLRVAGLARALAASHEIRILAVGSPSATAPPGIELRIVPPAPLQGLVRSPHRPLQVGLYRSAALGAAVERDVASWRPDVVVPVLSRLDFSSWRLGGTPVVLDLVDSLALNMSNRAVREGWLRPLFAWEALRMARWERRLAAAASVATVVSERDREAVAGGDAALAAKIHVIPLGLEIPPELPPVQATSPVVLLAGNLGYFPTLEGAVWFGREVWPRVRRAMPEAQWWLAGARPAAAVRRLERLPGVRVWADPPDLGALRRQARVAIAPLHAGSGTPIKVLEAMAEGVPVVATPNAASGLDGLAGSELAVAAGAEAFADEIVELLVEGARREHQRHAAFAWVLAQHDENGATARFGRLLEHAHSRGSCVPGSSGQLLDE